MKFDMHCHTKEGSMDGKVSVEEYIEILKGKNYGGMLITDHNSYKGYREFMKTREGKKFRRFVVMKGIEYDTIDAGHILIIMPENIRLRVLELRGLPVRLLIDIVHKNGGILGPAHPCGERYLSIIKTKRKKSKAAIMQKFDFVEIFNSCEDEKSNRAAVALAKKYNKPGFGGSDSHKLDCVGTAYTELPNSIRKESDLIAYVQSGATIECGGVLYEGTTKDRLGKFNRVLVESFFVYNKMAGLFRFRKRKEELEKI
jgi:Predicted metal-dependent phosphoesterases (PHP family)